MEHSILMSLLFTTALLLGSETALALNETAYTESHLERVHVKQKTGFDGKVRSIRFSLEPESDNKGEEKGVQTQINTRSKMKLSNVDSHDSIPPSSNQDYNIDETSSTLSTSLPRKNARERKLQLTTNPSPSVANAARRERSIREESAGSGHNDLQAQEAKVFRPLFVYRQQVARRLKLQSDKRLGGGAQPRIHRRMPTTHGYYYPYRYPPYRY